MLFRQRFFLLPALFFLCLNIMTGQNREIWEIQGTGVISPFVGETVSTTNNVVTAVGENYFFMQTPTERSDNDASTSDGIFVYVGNIPALQVNDLVDVSGPVIEFDGLTEFSGAGLNYNVVGEVSTLPAPIEFTSDFPSPTAVDIRDLEKVEGMRVHFTAQVVDPAKGNNPICALAVAPRPFREAGIPYPGTGAGIPVWDANPELFWLDPDELNQPNSRFLSFGQSVTATGVLFQSDDFYTVFPIEYSTTGQLEVRELPVASNDEFTVASINTLNLREDNEALPSKYPKLARYIVNQLGTPDIVALQEVGELSTLQELRFAILQIAPQANYTAYLIQGNNNTWINNAYLVSSRVRDVNVQQLGSTENFALGGRLHDRPPLLLTANLPTVPPTPIEVINVHIRSLSGTGQGDDDFIYTKRQQQAVSIAEMIQDRQDENLIVLGDFNAFPFSDGYADVMSQLTGTSSLGAQFPVEQIVDPPLTNHAYEQAPEELYSFVFRGSAQLIDHCLTTDLNDLSVADFAFARGNADAATAYFSNENISTRSSDHDGFVLYLETNLPILTNTEEDLTIRWILPNPVRASAQLPLPSLGQNLDLQLWNTSGQLVGQWQGVQDEIQLPEIPTGAYILHWSIDRQFGVEKLIIE